MELSSLNIRGTKVRVYVDEVDGTFKGTINGMTLKADSLLHLREKLTAEAKKASKGLAVPFTYYTRRDGTRDGEATGMHATRRVVLVKWSDGSRGDLSGHGYGGEHVMHRLTTAEAEELLTLDAKVRAAEQALSEFLKPRTIVLRDAVERALKEVLSDA
jgi:hypothetical protein